MFTTSPWAVYVYTVSPVIAGYYLFYTAKFYGKEIKARVSTVSGLRTRRKPDRVATENSDPSVEMAKIRPLSEPESSGQISSASQQQSRKTALEEHHDLKVHLRDLIGEAYRKDYDSSELILLVQRTIKDYQDFHRTQFQSMISELIENECAKYGLLHLGEKDKAAIWGKV